MHRFQKQPTISKSSAPWHSRRIRSVDSGIWHQPTNQQIRQTTEQPINQPSQQLIDQPASQQTNQQNNHTYLPHHVITIPSEYKHAANTYITIQSEREHIASRVGRRGFIRHPRDVNHIIGVRGGWRNKGLLVSDCVVVLWRVVYLHRLENMELLWLALVTGT